MLLPKQNPIPSEAETRLPLFDELRGLAIIGVIAIHAAVHDVGRIGSSVDYWFLVFQTMLSRFAVPSFLIISGFFVSYKEQVGLQTNIKDNMVRRIIRVVIPYVIWSSLYFLLFLLSGVQFSRTPAIIFLEQLLTGSVALHLFFLILIIQLYALSYFGFMRHGRVGKVTLLLAVVAFLCFTMPSYLLTIDTVAMTESKVWYYFKAFERALFPRWLLFFMLGRWMGVHWNEISNFSIKHRRLLSLGVFSSIGLCGLDFYCLRLWSGKAQVLPPDWMISCLLFGSLFTIWFLTQPRHTNLVLNWLAKLGRVSFGVYLLHEPFLSLLMSSSVWLSYTNVLSSVLLRQAVSILAGLGTSILILALIQSSLPKRARRYMLG
jgi:probable poly-beta-1,6-N-acetyl-D-glucosamine export protein